jgi:hypothetical protein
MKAAVPTSTAVFAISPSGQLRADWAAQIQLLIRPRAAARDLSPVPRQLPPSPMMTLPVGIEHPLNMPVQRPHDADPRQHRRPAQRRDQHQGFDCGLPFRGWNS